MQPRSNSKPNRAFFSRCLFTPNPPLGVSYCFSNTEEQHGTYFSLARAASHSPASLQMQTKHYRTPSKAAAPVCRGTGPSHRGAKHHKTFCKVVVVLPHCWQERAWPRGAKHQETVFKAAVATTTPLSPVGRADMAKCTVSWDLSLRWWLPFTLTLSNWCTLTHAHPIRRGSFM